MSCNMTAAPGDAKGHREHAKAEEVIIHCPKCNYSRQPTDTAPETECPSCGVVFEKLLSLPKASASVPPAPSPVASAPKPRAAAKPPVPEPAPIPTTTNCPACGGLVAYGARSCPHCGKDKPAPKPPAPPTKVTKKHLLIAGGCIALFMLVAGNQPDRPAPLTAQEVVNLCAKEIGIDPHSSTPLTMQNLRDIEACASRYGYKPKQ